MTARRPRRSLLLVAAMVATVVAACGLPRDPVARDIPPDELPESLTATSLAATTTAAPTEAALEVYLLGEDPEGRVVLTPRTRPVSDREVSTLIAELTRVTEEESADGLRTLVPAETEVVGEAVVETGTLTLPLSDPFYDVLQGDNRSRAAAQIVFSATTFELIDRVLFVDGEGEPRVIPTTDGVLPDPPRPMTREDFAAVNPLSVTGGD